MNPDSIIVKLLAELYGWHCASVRPGDRDAACEAVEAFRRDGAIPFTLAGSARDREKTLSKLQADGLITVSGATRDRRCGLTWGGLCRATALTIGACELQKVFDLMRQIEKFAQSAGGEHVAPSGATPDYLMTPELGDFWSACTPDKRGVWALAMARTFDELLPAIVMRWVYASATCHGCRWYRLTDAGQEALKHPPAIPKNLPDATLTDLYISESDKSFHAARHAEPRDPNAVFVPKPCSRWWPVKSMADEKQEIVS